jgi:UDP-3-O-[3-hydroxymyristoyl] glucosamine N-acyltransferase
MPEFSARELAEKAGGRLVGSPDAAVTDVASPEEAGASDLAFLRDEKNAEAAAACSAAVLITPVEVDGFAGAQIVCDDAELAMAAVLAEFAAERFPPPEGVAESAFVDPSAQIGEGAGIGAGAFVGAGAVIGDAAAIGPLAYIGAGCRIGAGTRVHGHVSVHDRVEIGADCILHYGCVIGAAGFGFLQREGRHIKMPQVGTVRVGERVEIGALTTIDRATLGATVVGDGVKIDNHCHIAHNCRLGPDCILAGYTKIAGSVELGKGVVCAENVGISDHVRVGDGAVLAASAGVVSDVEPGAVLLGAPARPIARQRRIWAIAGRLPEMLKRLRELENRAEAIEKRLTEGP